MGQLGGRCFICGERTEGCTTREITVLGALCVEACAPCVDLPDTPEFVNRLIVERLMPQESVQRAAEAQLGLSGVSYQEERAAVMRRLKRYRQHLEALGLTASPYPSRWGDKDSAWRSGYEAALRDLAEHPEIVRET